MTSKSLTYEEQLRAYLKECPEPLSPAQEAYFMQTFKSLALQEPLQVENKRLTETVDWMHELIWNLIERIRNAEEKSNA